jgi:nitrile hydratase
MSQPDQSHDRDHDQRHDHPHAEISQSGRPGYYDMMETAVRELLIERQLIGPDEIRRQIEVLDSRTPALGAKVVARAWVDPAFRARLLADGRAACEELGISFYDDTSLIVLDNTDKVHNLIICTLCSCYPRPVLGLPPDWYKLKPYRSRAVSEPRAVLAEFGTIIPDDVEVRVHDSTAMVRYLVLPRRPEGTERYSEGQLAALVTRDTMIGVVPASVESGRTTQ